MEEERHHVELIKGITEQLKPVMNRSPQAMYAYLDDIHKVCNKKFADLLGYASPQAWAKMATPLDDVVEDDQDAVVLAFRNATDKLVASQIDVRLRNVKTKKIVKTTMIEVPMAFSGHVYALKIFSKG